MDLRTRRRALMAQGKAEPEGNRISEVVPHGTTAITLNSDQTITLTSWAASWAGRFDVKFKNAIPIKNGDAVRYKLTSVSGTAPSASSAMYLYTPQKVFFTNRNFKTWVMDTTHSFTSTADFDHTYFYIQNTAAISSIDPPFTFRVSIWVNDVLVLGEG